MDLNPKFWKGKRVLITGNTGFKGSWLSLLLQTLEADVIGYALTPPTNPSLFEVAMVDQEMITIFGDIRDLNHLHRVFTEHRPEIVIHMAAQPLVRYSYLNPVETYSTNVMGTVNLLEAVRRTKSVRAVVNVTSDKCYENREQDRGYHESEAMGGYDPYSNSKGCAELVTAAYRNSYFDPKKHSSHGVGVASGRAGNVIGGGDWAKDRLVPDIIKSFESGKRVSIRYPHAIRPWQHVLEPLRGYLMLAENLYTNGAKFSQAWNFGPNDDDTKPVSFIVEAMTKIWGEDAKWSLDKNFHPHEANYLKLDISKAHLELDWQPVMRLSDTLKLIVEWSKHFKAGENMRDFTINQIKDYQNNLTKN
jgi:CDP-glucose 4,6-dehydratase